MFSTGKTLVLFFFALTIASATAKTLTQKQAREAAARIDSLLSADLQAANLKPNGRIDDGTFLRRAYLGIIGRIPTEQESSTFLNAAGPDKRAALVDTLSASPGFDSHLFNWTADLLRIQTDQEQFGLGWHVWLRKSLAEDKPWDSIVREMLSSTGHTAKDPAVGYYLRDRNMQLDNFSNTMQVFLGRQIGCAQCHDHPFDDWSQLEYYKMAAFGGGFQYRSTDAMDTVRRVVKDTIPGIGDRKNFDKPQRQARRKMQMGGSNEGRKIVHLLKPVLKDFNKNALYDNPSSSLRLPEDYQYADAQPNDRVEPETLFGEHLTEVDPTKRREAFAKWLTSRENPYFTKVIANRLWARTFGHGLLDPVDDWNDESKPAHPQLLAFLETTMKDVDYDLRQFTRVLFLTDLFQRECDTTEPEPGVPHLVRGPALQRMTAEQLYDSMLVLRNGTIEDSPLSKNASRWETYTASIEKLLSAGSHDLLVLGESASQSEAAFRTAQSEVRKLRSQIAESKTDTERRALAIKIRTTQRKAIQYRRQGNPIAMMSGDMSMMEMEPSMDENQTGKGKGKGKFRNKANRNGNKPKASARASELPAPFNPGTLIREFGGSDRTTPSSGNTIPTVPQALALLNDPITDIAGNGRLSTLPSSLDSLKNPGEKLDLIFLRLYSRPPTEQEKQTFIPLAKDPLQLRDLTRAMLTSNQFIFIQ